MSTMQSTDEMRNMLRLTRWSAEHATPVRSYSVPHYFDDPLPAIAPIAAQRQGGILGRMGRGLSLRRR